MILKLIHKSINLEHTDITIPRLILNDRFNKFFFFDLNYIDQHICGYLLVDVTSVTVNILGGIIRSPLKVSNDQLI